MIKCKITGRNNHYEAFGEYKDGKLKVLKGSVIWIDKKVCFKMADEAQKYREDKNYVDKDGKLKEDIIFSSPSTAAQFVTGNSTNGLRQWKNLDTGKALKECL